MTASVLKQDPNTKRFKRTLIYFNTDTQYAHFQGNPLCQAKQSVCEPITINFEFAYHPVPEASYNYSLHTALACEWLFSMTVHPGPVTQSALVSFPRQATCSTEKLRKRHYLIILFVFRVWCTISDTLRQTGINTARIITEAASGGATVWDRIARENWGSSSFRSVWTKI